MTLKKFSFSKKQTVDLFFVLFFGLLVCLFVRRTFQNDTYYLIKIGEYILDNGLDFKDHYAWAADLGYTYPHFLYNIFLAFVYRSFGFDGVYASVLVFGFLLAVSIYFVLNKVAEYTTSKLSMRFFVGFATAVIVACTFGTFVCARSQTITYVLWLFEALLLMRMLDAGRSRYMIGVVFISWLVAMMHATAWYFTFILFIPFIVACYISKEEIKIASNGLSYSELGCSDKIVFMDEHQVSNLKYLWISLIAAFAVGLFTPSRICYSATFKIMSSGVQDYIVEFQPMVVANTPYFLIAVGLFVVVFALFKSKCRLDLLLLYCGVMIMSFLSVRHGMLFVLFGSMAFVYSVGSVLNDVNISVDIPVLAKRFLFGTICVVFIIAGLFRMDKTFGDYEDPLYAPTDVVKYIKGLDNYESLRIFNPYNIGSYLLFNDIPVFIDSRANIYTKAFSPELEYSLVDDLVALNHFSSEWYDVEARYDFDYFIISNTSDLCNVFKLMDDKELVFSGEKFNVYASLPANAIPSGVHE